LHKRYPFSIATIQRVTIDGFKKMHQPSRAGGMPISATKSANTGRSLDVSF
jgi:hypothetical protein